MRYTLTIEHLLNQNKLQLIQNLISKDKEYYHRKEYGPNRDEITFIVYKEKKSIFKTTAIIINKVVLELKNNFPWKWKHNV